MANVPVGYCAEFGDDDHGVEIDCEFFEHYDKCACAVKIFCRGVRFEIELDPGLARDMARHLLAGADVVEAARNNHGKNSARIINFARRNG